MAVTTGIVSTGLSPDRGRSSCGSTRRHSGELPYDALNPVVQQIYDTWTDADGELSVAAAIMEQRRLGLITEAMTTVPGHHLAQASREFLQLYPNAKILVADETNFVKEKRQRFLARAVIGIWGS